MRYIITQPQICNYYLIIGIRSSNKDHDHSVLGINTVNIKCHHQLFAMPCHREINPVNEQSKFEITITSQKFQITKITRQLIHGLLGLKALNAKI